MPAHDVRTSRYNSRIRGSKWRSMISRLGSSRSRQPIRVEGWRRITRIDTSNASHVMQYGKTRGSPCWLVQVESLSLLTCWWSKEMIFICVLRIWKKLESIDEKILWETFPNKQHPTHNKEASDQLFARRRGRDRLSMKLFQGTYWTRTKTQILWWCTLAYLFIFSNP
jgi:hypothetical protein